MAKFRTIRKRNMYGAIRGEEMYALPVEEDEEKREMRPRDELEKQLAAQIVLGAITSVDAARHDENEDALEYGAQTLFDNERAEVANTRNLAPHIVRHLMKDRNLDIRYNVIKKHWKHVPEETRQQFYKNVTTVAIKYKDEEREWQVTGPDSLLLVAAKEIIQAHVSVDNDEFVSKMLELYQYVPGTRCKWIEGHEKHLRNMPRTMAMIYYAGADLREMDLMVPNVKQRLEVVKKVVKMKVGELSDRFTHFARDAEHEGGGNVKDLVYKFIAEDPNPRVRRLLIESTNHKATLEFVRDNEEDTLICRKARMKLARVNARAAYAKKYHTEKNQRLTMLPIPPGTYHIDGGTI